MEFKERTVDIGEDCLVWKHHYTGFSSPVDSGWRWVHSGTGLPVAKRGSTLEAALHRVADFEDAAADIPLVEEGEEG